jgi:hypothetical protein
MLEIILLTPIWDLAWILAFAIPYYLEHGIPSRRRDAGCTDVGQLSDGPHAEAFR